MGGDSPSPKASKDVELAQEPSASKAAWEGKPAAIAKQPQLQSEKEHEAGAFKRFMTGPYFDVIPSQYERVTTSRAHHARLQLHQKPGAQSEEKSVEAGGGKDAKEEAEFQAMLQEDYLGRLRKIVSAPVDVDGVYGLTHEELVPLPFDVPKWHAYMMDIALTVYLVAQATVVMFIAIYVENQERAWKSGDSYTKSWLPLVKALIIVYPLVTLLVLVYMAVEYAIRKFMYFRMLSMRILVDWANHQFYLTLFFWYFVGTWAMMNAWAIYGVATYYNTGGNNGVDPVSFGTFVVVNLQTIQLLVQYMKMMSTESRLVALNQIFERAPVEAQRLLEFTYVVEEADLIDECYAFAANSQKAFFGRLLNIFTCGCAGKNWHGRSEMIRFDIERLKCRAANYVEVERNVRQLKDEHAEGVSKHDSQKMSKASTRNRLTAPEQIAVNVEGTAEATAPEATAAGLKLGPDGRALPRVMPPSHLTCCGWNPIRAAYGHYYGSLHSVLITIMPHFPSWPFRPDVAYFRLLTFMQVVGMFAVGAIVVLGWLVSARESNCTKSAKTCNTCLSVHERYFASAEPVCSAMETAVAGIVASANGTWLDGGVLKERYCSWQCFGNFTPTSSCPAQLG